LHESGELHERHEKQVANYGFRKLAILFKGNTQHVRLCVGDNNALNNRAAPAFSCASSGAILAVMLAKNRDRGNNSEGVPRPEAWSFISVRKEDDAFFT
jgi:hypothetical protein